MKYIIVLVIVFSTQLIKAENEQLKNFRELINQITKITQPTQAMQIDKKNNILNFVKSTLEDRDYASGPYALLRLESTACFSESDNKIEMIGNYLNLKTSEELSEQIQKNCVAEGEILLQDFFNSIVYKEFRNRFEKIIQHISTCNFFTQEESKKLCESKIFYPDNYEKHLYKWNIIFENNNIKALEGKIRKIIELKKNDKLINNDFLMIVDAIYQCSMRELDVAEIYNEPHHNMFITVTFCHNKDFNCNSVSFIFYLFGGMRFILIKNNDIENQHDKSWYDFRKSLIYEVLEFAHSYNYSAFDHLEPQIVFIEK